jgi:hypothetical protein
VRFRDPLCRDGLRLLELEFRVVGTTTCLLRNGSGYGGFKGFSRRV